MAGDFNNKNIDGITDLVVVAPIREGFIPAYENVTYATRLKLVAEALNRVRVAAREHERITPYSDVTERILTLLDFRIGIIDKDLLSLQGLDSTSPSLQSRRYLYLTATFDGAWEPYMRLIWDPLGPFLDLLFINCENYVTAVDHSFDEYTQWVRDNQVNSAIFYAASGLTVRDGLYLSNLERLQRREAAPLALAEATMPQPETLAADTRDQHLVKAFELGLEALTVLYRLADYYPPQWLTGRKGKLKNIKDGHRLVQVAQDLLKGWDDVVPKMQAAHPAAFALASQVYREPLSWFATGKDELDRIKRARDRQRRTDPALIASEVQAGILKQPGGQPRARQGALLLFSITDAAQARAFLKDLPVSFHGDMPGETNVTLGLTAEGLRRLGADRALVDRFPREFREGMAARSGLIGDMRENHPRNWILPERNGPALLGLVPESLRLPPVELSEVDIAIQLRRTSSDEAALTAAIVALASKAGVTLQAVEWMEADYDAQGQFQDHFGFTDGISQPQPLGPNPPAGPTGDEVRLGEILLGYGNDRTDAAPGPYRTLKGWRRRWWKAAHALQQNGTFLVVRKIGTEAEAFEAWITEQVEAINREHALETPMTPDRLKARILGRSPNGAAPLPTGPGGGNVFDFNSDATGRACPLASHIRRANPRRTLLANNPGVNVAEFDRPTPRILRRGMRFTQGGQKGLMFMAYNASIAEQYEVIQRWLNGGNSTDIASAHNCPLTGVQPKGTGEPGVFRFVETGANGQPVPIAVTLRAVLPGAPPTGASEPGRHPFAPLHWGLYLFVPSRSAIARLAAMEGHYSIMPEPLENAVGMPIVRRLEALDDNAAEARQELKRLLEDFDAKDPAEADLTPNVWSTIRWQLGGAHKFESGAGFIGYDWQNGPDIEQQPAILCAGTDQVRAVLADWRRFSSEEQLRRIAPNSGPIFVTQQPDNRYGNTALNKAGLNYPAEAKDTNALLMAYGEADGFAAGYAAGAAVLLQARLAAQTSGRTSFKLELRRQYLLPALAGLCWQWYGLPDGAAMDMGGWTWAQIVGKDQAESPRTRNSAVCPGDFLSPSRNAFYPRPGDEVAGFAESHGTAILQAATEFVKQHRPSGGASIGSQLPGPNDTAARALFTLIARLRGPAAPPPGTVARAMFTQISDDAVLARNLVGTMVGAIPPMDGNLRGILFEWLSEKSLWRHQAALRTAVAGRPAITNFAMARAVLYGPVSQAMCKRPAPDLLYRTARTKGHIRVKPKIKDAPRRIEVNEGDLLVVSQVSAAQRSLLRLRPSDTGQGDVSIVFGGQRQAPDQGYQLKNGRAVPVPGADPRFPVHACPAQDMAMGAIMGIMAALLDAGTIQALPASLIVKISDWPPMPPQAGG